MVVIPPQDPVSAPWGFFEWATSSLVALFGIVLGFVVKTVTQLNNHKAQLKNLDEKLEKQEIINKSNVEELQEIKDRISGKSGKGELNEAIHLFQVSLESRFDQLNGRFDRLDSRVDSILNRK